MDLKRLNHVVALAETRNFSRAAKRVHLTQPAFSRSIQAAEADLGLQLFDRSTREVTCTAAGKFVIAKARALLFESRSMQRDIDLYLGRQSGELAFGVGPYVAATLLLPLAIDLRTRYPGVSSRVEINHGPALLAQLRAEELEFFVTMMPDIPRDPDLAVSRIGRIRTDFFVRAGHPLLAREGWTIDDLARYGLATMKFSAGMRGVFRKLLGLGKRGYQPIALECDDVHLLTQVALTTDAVLVVPPTAAREQVAAGRLHPITLKNPPRLRADLGIVTLDGRSHSPMAAYAVSFVREFMAKHGDEWPGSVGTVGATRTRIGVRAPRRTAQPR